ncbi:hypothetical protein [Actinosynnema sp. NPDC023587]|uniref:hypothetical protein n=1 Tax=Actinosynnema sp. NPDC023587 TaxID=3154695 RepID=UPI00340FF601
MDLATAFRIDYAHDLDQASDGISRYGAYLARSDLFREWGSAGTPTADPAEFADAAVRTALPPVMSPGYVRTDPRVVTVSTHWDDDVVRLSVAVTLVSTPPEPVARVSRSWTTWRRDSGRWTEPHDATGPVLLPTLTVRVPIPADLLPTPSYRDGVPRLDSARHAVAVVVAECNRVASPVLAALALAGVR